MGMVAIFALCCCNKEIIHGRFHGDSENPPSLNKCPHGCQVPLNPNGKPKGAKLRFLRYESEDLVSPELYATWAFPDRTSKLLNERRKQSFVKPKEESSLPFTQPEDEILF